jgi:hypothetical protein
MTKALYAHMSNKKVKIKKKIQKKIINTVSHSLRGQKGKLKTPKGTSYHIPALKSCCSQGVLICFVFMAGVSIISRFCS